ncbi:thiol:disulfide interchange protein DsbA precursor [bacterium BMS3Bbin12]|nr:thiol:disulfide interchange protein DsbA precursor [bacterium BMS3Abin12]GBE48937.1 thiol:disulfide interchange protein DsbA precursor [bacterium BMS3Bbin12]GBE49841.1 thiol:disulfide interchange protein DsbA precursor [bacterium BMS3Bbin13]
MEFCRDNSMKSQTNRRRWQRCLVPFLWVLLVSVAWAAPSPPGGAKFEAGFDYRLIDPPVRIPGAEPGKVTVVEFFWYGCPHCYRLEPYLDKWLKHKPPGVQFIRIPAPLNAAWTVHARAYYAAKELGVLSRLFQPLFNAIQREGSALGTEDALADFFARHGVKPAAFRTAYGSFTVDAEVRRARALAQRIGITGVPTVVVAGKYRTGMELAGSDRRLIAIVNYLVRKESRRGLHAGAFKSAAASAANQSTAR